MHELSVIMPIIQVGDRIARDNHIENITAMRLAIGELHDLEDEWALKFFDKYKKNTRLENAELKIRHIPIRYKCNTCSAETEFTRLAFIRTETIVCGTCGSTDNEMISGRELQMEGLEYRPDPPENHSEANTKK